MGLPADAQLSWFLQLHLDNFIVKRKLLPVYRDYAIWTVTSGRENSRPSTGTVQKLMPALTQTATPHTTGPLWASRSALTDSIATSEKRTNFFFLKNLVVTCKICSILTTNTKVELHQKE
jgi:hypothetical protein